jgi:hypothetical protein
MFNHFESEGFEGTGGGASVPEAQKILQGLLGDLPDEAQILHDKVNREIARIQEEADDEIARIREQAEQRAAVVAGKADKRRAAILQHSVEQLEPLQKELFRAGELGKALGTFVLIQMLRARALDVRPDPGNLMQFQEIGKSYCFQIVGSNQGAVWGTDTYTADSHLASAAVHAGAIELGEDAVVRVSVVDMAGMTIRGSLRHGVITNDWDLYRVGFRVARA